MSNLWKLLFKLISLGYLAFVLWLCLNSNIADDLKDLPKGLFSIELTDKMVHTIMFLPWCFFFYFSFFSRKMKPWKIVIAMAVTLVCGMATGYALELAQNYIPRRSYDIADFYHDCYGVWIGAVVPIYLCCLPSGRKGKKRRKRRA